MGCSSCMAYALPSNQVRVVRRGLSRVRVAVTDCGCDACETKGGGSCALPERDGGAVAVVRRAGTTTTADYIATYTAALARARSQRDAGDPYDPFSDENNDGTNDASVASAAIARLSRERQRALDLATTAAERAATNARFDSLSGPQKEQLMRAAAREAGADDAATTRLIATGITQGLAAFNAALAGSYGVAIARINADRDIQIARITGRSPAQDALLAALQPGSISTSQQPLTVQSSNTETGLLLLGGAALVFAFSRRS